MDRHNAELTLIGSIVWKLEFLKCNFGTFWEPCTLCLCTKYNNFLGGVCSVLTGNQTNFQSKVETQ